MQVYVMVRRAGGVTVFRTVNTLLEWLESAGLDGYMVNMPGQPNKWIINKPTYGVFADVELHEVIE